MIRIAIIDDHPMLRRGLSDLIELEDDLVLVANLGDPTQAVKVINETEPDIVLLDFNMPGQDGIQTLRQIKNEALDVRIIMFTVSNNPNDIHQAIRAGADGYILKDIEPELLIEEIRRCATGQQVISDSIREIVKQAIQSRTPDGRNPAISELTDRELDVLQLVAEGLTNRAIGERLSIAEGTVKVHVKRMLAKLHLRSRVEAAIFALEHTHEL